MGGLIGLGFALLLLIPSLLAQSTTTSTSRAARSSSSGPPGFFFVILVGVMVLSFGGSVLGWFARTYTVGQRELVIDEGILSRRKRVVPYARVQQVDVSQSLVHQVLSVGTLKIDTAGEAGATSIKLGLLDIKLARGIRSHILRRRAELQGTLRGPGAPTAPGPPGSSPAPGAPGGGAPTGTPWAPGTPAGPGSAPVTPAASTGYGAYGAAPYGYVAANVAEVTLLKLNSSRLALAGLTHHVVVLSFPVALLVAAYIVVIAAASNAKTTLAAVAAVTIPVALGIALFIAALSMIQYVIGQYGFTVAESGDDLHLRFGLFQVRNLTIPRRRVQHITIVDNPLRRALGIVAVHLHSAARMGVEGGNAAASTRFEIPILRRADLDAFLHATMGGDWHIPELTPRPPGARRRAMTRRSMLIAVLLLPLALVSLPASLALLGLAPIIGVPWGLIAHRRAGYAETAEIAVLSHGVLRHHIDLIPFSRIQSCATEQNPMQRRSKLRTLHVNVAGPSRDPHLHDMAATDAVAYLADLPRRSAR